MHTKRSSAKTVVINPLATHPICAALHWSASVRGDALRALGVSGHWGQVHAGLVHADHVVSTPHPVLDNAHVEEGALVEAP